MTDNTLCLINLMEGPCPSNLFDYEVYAYSHPEVHDGELIFFEVDGGTLSLQSLDGEKAPSNH